MSRIGKMPISIPNGVDVKTAAGSVTVKGPKGELTLKVPPAIEVSIEDGVLSVERPSDVREHRALHGLTRSLVANMVQGVTEGFKKTLSIVGVGYRAEKKGKDLTLHLGFSHPIQYKVPDGVSVEVPQPTVVVVESSDKQKCGQVAAEIRSFRPPEPYKGKGVRYENEHVRRKAGKTAGA